MSQRAIRRGQQRRQAAERRKEMLKRRRAGLAVTAAIGATALFAPAAANAADFRVTTDGDGAATTCGPASGDCNTLRDAISAANATTEDDVITFAADLSGHTITLDPGKGELPIDASDYGLTIQGLGASNLTVSGDDESRIFHIDGSNPVEISGLTLTGGHVSGEDGGAILAEEDTDVTIADSTFTANSAEDSGEPNYNGGNGGAIASFGELTVTGSTFTDGDETDGNSADNTGGAIFTGQQGLTVRDTRISGNTAGAGGGIGSGINYDIALEPSPENANPVGLLGPRPVVDVTDSDITGNNAFDGAGFAVSGLLTLARTNVTQNIAKGVGGGIDSVGKYAQTDISDSTISNNSAITGGGMSVAQFYGFIPGEVKHALKSEVKRTTISGNDAEGGGGGIAMKYLADGDDFTISNSTISGNDAATGELTGYGGGILFAAKYAYDRTPFTGGPIDGDFRTIDTTISGNTADRGGGVSVGYEQSLERTASKSKLADKADAAGKHKLADHLRASASATQVRHPVVDEGSIDFQNSTIASNGATETGGGVYLPKYYAGWNEEEDRPIFLNPTISLTSSILANNSADNTANDAARDAGSGEDASSGGGLDSSFSLIEQPGNVPIIHSPAGSNLTGVDPQLGGLANNGGPTLTQLPSLTSPVVDKGKAPARLLDDQRGQNRTVDGSGVTNAHAGDGTDIGAVEVQNPGQAQNIVQPPIIQQQQNNTDETPPKTTLRVPRSLSIAHLIRGFNVSVGCNEPCSMTFRGYASAPTGTLHSSGYNFRLFNKKTKRKSGKRKVHLRPCVIGSKSKRRTHVCRGRLTAALFAKPQKTFKVKLVIAAKDKAGNVSHRKRFIKIHR